MTILGIGTDIVENNRIKNAIKNNSFIKRIFSKDEISFSKKFKNKTNFYSKRFAAKEAFVKAIGTGFRNSINFKDISILNNKLGKPKLYITVKVKKLLKKMFKSKNIDIFLSLADEKKYSIAFLFIKK